MRVEQQKTLTLYVDSEVIAAARRHIAACAVGRDLRVVSLDENHGRFSSTLTVTVSGHPRRVREFRDDVRGDALSGGDPVALIAAGAVLYGYRAARRRWLGRNDPPLEDGVDPNAEWTTVYWRREDEGSDGEAVGSVWVDTYTGGRMELRNSEQWPDRVRRSEALAYASEHGFAFFADQ